MPSRTDNLPFAFRGETLSPKRLLSEAEARALLTARNPTGKPNADVLRETIGVDSARNTRTRWMLDFPPGMSAAEAALYVEPFRFLRQRGLRPGNPDRSHDLRTALARIDRFLAMPVSAPAPAFDWVEGEPLPDDSLIVWARDDDFSAGILGSRGFAVWWNATPGFAALQSFPFPWPPATPLSKLTTQQEEHRHAIARAARAADQDAIDETTLRAYALGIDAGDDEILAALHARR
jgi:hypothetical protein